MGPTKGQNKEDSASFPEAEEVLRELPESGLGKEFHRGRREALRQRMPDSSVACFFASPVRNRSKDVDYPYHPDRDLFYLSGLTDPHALLLIFKDTVEVLGERSDELLFLKSSEGGMMGQWEGERFGKKKAREILGFNSVFHTKTFVDRKIGFDRFNSIHHSSLHEDLRDDTRDRGDLASLIAHFRDKTDEMEARREEADLRRWMNALRAVKTSREIRLLKQACRITSEAHNHLMRAMESGMMEYEAEAIVEYWFQKKGCKGPGFPSIVGSGENSCILHYTDNRDRMDTNELVVVDVGGEFRGYTADVTRTLPVNDTFSDEQRAIYELVLRAQKAAIEACQPGKKFWAPHSKARSIISNGMQELGIIDGRSEVRQYFMHGTSHYMGLDVHDPGPHGSLESGNVLTVEPGIYIPAGSDCNERWWDIGVRIEDDILVTDDGPENLSNGVPKEVEEVEGQMQEESVFNRFE